MRRPRLSALWILPAAALLAAGVALAQQGDPVTQALDATVQINRAGAQSQQRVDKLDDETRRMLERYRAALWQEQQLSVYATQLGELLASQETEKQSLSRQIGEMDRVESELMPLMLRMLDNLEKFVKLDLPFLREERAERIASLRRMMADPAAGVAEKYRRMLEAFQVENDYGRSLGAERVEADGKVIDVLRVGRVAMYGLTLDGEEAMVWDRKTGAWGELEDRFLPGIRRGLKIAREVAAADVLVLPMPAAEALP